MTEQTDIMTQYAAGVKLSAAMKTATIVLLEQAGGNVVKCETLNCSARLNEVSDWLDENTGAADVSMVVGVDSSQVRFLDIRIPDVAESQQMLLLRTQAEAILPLSADEMTMAWRAEEDTQGLLCKTAVIRRQLIQPLMDQPFEKLNITPEAVGLAAAWARRTNHGAHACILLLRREHDFLAVSQKAGRLLHSTVIDAGGDDIHTSAPSGLLLQDIQTELETMQGEYPEKMPVSVLTDAEPDTFLTYLCNQIQGAGWDCETVSCNEFSHPACGIDAVEAFGLALAATDAEQIDFDFCRAELMQRPDEDRNAATAVFYKTVAFTVLLLALALGASYWSVKHEVKLLREVIATENEGRTVQQVLTEQSYRETVARARPDMTDLFERIEKCKGKILLDTFEFEKGKPVKITATAQSYDAAYEFQKKLETENKNIITLARLLDPRMDQKNNKVQFTLTFHYRNFSQ